MIKTLNTLFHGLMIQPSLLNEQHDVFICSDDEEAKEILGWVGVPDRLRQTAQRAIHRDVINRLDAYTQHD